jgi:hypothetical protein
MQTAGETPPFLRLDRRRIVSAARAAAGNDSLTELFKRALTII